ncbi:peptidase domain-containing ABC transporter [Caulobacter sp.]|uniref:peptidase domain-containing ABC transporter n=1 Tax=Caulobacter sp. TaxID=78 RepID=UPI001B17237B|nr:peptidase domain-containing ABC transporter [Caulobacter sp.]MBO9545874.1 peptidase domain-containing ABC transporter [Caulobacter sp.]
MPYAAGPKASRLEIVRQQSASECGLACLTMIARYHGLNWSLAGLRAAFPISLRGMSIQNVRQVAGEMGLDCRAVRVEPSGLSKLAGPAILHWGFDHFVVLKRMRGDRALIHDPTSGRRWVDAESLSDKLTGLALVFAPSQTPGRAPSGVRETAGRLEALLRQVWSRDVAVGAGLALVLTLLVQLYTLAAPLAISTLVNHMMSRSGPSPTVIVLALLTFTVLTSVGNLLRSATITRVAITASHRLSLRLYEGLIVSPLTYFENRKVAQLTAGYDAKEALEDIISSRAIGAVLDGIGVLVVLGVMAYLSPPLFAISAASTAALVGLMIPLLRQLRRVSLESTNETARVQEMFLELIRNVHAIKAFSATAHFIGEWRQRTTVAFDLRAHLLRSNNLRSVVVELVGGVDFALILGVGGWLVFQGRMEAGALLALVFLRTQLMQRLDMLSQNGVVLGTLDLHFHRFADMLPMQLPDAPGAAGPAEPPPASIALRGVTFEYGQNLPRVLDGVDLDYSAGEFLGVTGASGEGKTSIIKVALGFYTPTGGEVLVDGAAADAQALERVRLASATLLQSDRPIVATIAENIAFARLGDFDEEKIWWALSAVELDNDVRRMPMGINTLVGDIGSGLSGGQTQRLLLARALYRSPTLLFLDEATSQIDPPTEARIFERLRALGMGCICVAHRNETLSRMDRVVRISGGRVLADDHDLIEQQKGAA